MKKTTISLPNYFVNLSDGAKVAAVERRLKRAAAIPSWRAQLAIFASLAFLVIAIVTVTAFAATRPDGTFEEVKVIEVPKVVSDRIPWTISSEDEELVSRVVAAMARGEGNLTQQAVAQAICNACETKHMTVSEVVEWAKYPVYAGEVPVSCKDVTKRVMEGYTAIDATILFCYNPDIQTGDWHETQEFVAQIGSLRFFNEINK